MTLRQPNERLREDLARHVEAMGYPLAADVIRAGDELPELDTDATYVPVEQGRLPLEELPVPANVQRVLSEGI